MKIVDIYEKRVPTPLAYMIPDFIWNLLGASISYRSEASTLLEEVVESTARTNQGVGELNTMFEESQRLLGQVVRNSRTIETELDEIKALHDKVVSSSKK